MAEQPDNAPQIPDDYADIYHRLKNPDRFSTGTVFADVMIEAIERIAKAEAALAEARATLARVGAKVTDEEWAKFVGIMHEYDGDSDILVQSHYDLATLDKVDRIIAARIAPPQPGSGT